MCTSFVYRNENILTGMNFDNDGKKFKVIARQGYGFLVSVQIKGNFYPSIGISSKGVFVNNQMVDSNGEGAYKRQTDKRWVNSSLIDRVMAGSTLDSLKKQMEGVEIVNGPFLSTHNLLADSSGNTLVVEPGRRIIPSSRQNSAWYLMTNFPLSDYDALVPIHPAGSGADRFNQAGEFLSSHTGHMSVDQGFDLLHRVRQNGPDWQTDLALIFDPAQAEVTYVLSENPGTVIKFKLN
jgi:hypothetical protein